MAVQKYRDPRDGKWESVIADADILSAVQALLAAP
jgi:hypothetical protein